MLKLKRMAMASSLSLSLLLAGCNNADPAVSVEEVEKETPVKVDVVTKGNLSVEETIMGKVAASQSVDVMPKLAGELTSVKVKKGMQVKKGDVLAVLDKNDLQTSLNMEEVSYLQAQSQLDTAKISKVQSEHALQNAKVSLKQAELNLQSAKDGQSTNVTSSGIGLSQAEVSYNQAKANYDRTKILFEGGYVSKSQYEDAESAMNQAKLSFDQAKLSAQNAEKTTDVELVQQQLDQAKIGVLNAEQQVELSKVGVEQAKIGVDSAALRVKHARNQVNDATIVAPASGEVTVVNGAAGEMISSSQPFVTIVTLDAIEIKGTVSAEQLATFTKGQEIKVEIPALNETVSATVSYIASVANEAGFYTIEATVPNEKKALKPGMLAQFIQTHDVVKESVLIPTEAIMENGEETYVFAIEEDKAVRRDIEVIQSQTELSAIKTEDLNEGDQIVIKGQLTLTDGNKVTIVEEGR